MLHGRVPGRDFRLDLAVRDGGSLLRIEVTDTRGEHPPPTAAFTPEDIAESGRGMLIVKALADRWGIARGPVSRKTIWAEIDLAPRPRHQVTESTT